jgi:hypothetical protein
MCSELVRWRRGGERKKLERGKKIVDNIKKAKAHLFGTQKRCHRMLLSEKTSCMASGDLKLPEDGAAKDRAGLETRRSRILKTSGALSSSK